MKAEQYGEGCSCSLSGSDPVPRLTGSLGAHTVSNTIHQLLAPH